jgi:hypothetical protein
MKIPAILLTSIVFLCVTGCTTTALRQNTTYQSQTVSDVLGNEVLYNLALAKDFYDGLSYNGIPSFVTLASGQTQIQDSVSPQLSMTIPVHGGGTSFGPQISGSHQTQDNWSFVPVIDPNVLNRLYWLYRAEFTNIPPHIVNDVLFPSQEELDSQGRPSLVYTPKLDSEGNVVMTNNQPVFTAKPKPCRKPKTVADIPGAWQDSKGTVRNGWFAIDPNAKDIQPSWKRAPSYLHRTIYITNCENFVAFAVLALGGTNGAPTLTPRPFLFLNQNGLITLPSR